MAWEKETCLFSSQQMHAKNQKKLFTKCAKRKNITSLLWFKKVDCFLSLNSKIYLKKHIKYICIYINVCDISTYNASFQMRILQFHDR